ncbi:suppressor of cytokine signaling 7-like isoform X1 [Phyllopteryx taeniolatus]|uniref:suppressor of cytokine signaling 7-like isoform X1 n=1 Tax=Phyllopteryx taeniolatus TaxID=161469 RepID=UPI002AD3B406|nr:suppressor of cytokine signaling 7-like isoform X1 [Phyllopteryx taeniolatus]XP_061606143.1 suppressor of cytokine signaling 7-like isoform X1 [Phyllopteryx taeniolatus]XP_061606144.1 suppressor of cytokine signaling 7-like isoform X1 [Phyllopteryx taeniolatus]XP_061606145.1 suppressor of cytokine signaling 7-like isoform X1 [Phyllopteryx taeniolatus]
MSDEMSPDFVLMRLLVSAAEYEHLEHQPEHVTSGKAGLVRGGFDVDSGGAPTGLGSASPHYGSPLPGKGELEGGLLMPEALPDSDDPSLPAEENFDFPGSTGSRAQLMVFRNRMLDFGLEQPPLGGNETRWVDSSESGSGSAVDAEERDPCFGPSSEENRQWRPEGSDPSGSVLCHPLGKWSPLTLLDSRSNRGANDEELVLALNPGPDQAGCREGNERVAAPLPRCSCLLASGAAAPGEDPSETSDALLVLEGLGADGDVGEGGTCRRAGPVFSSGTLSGLMQQVHRLAGEAGVCTHQTWRTPTGSSLRDRTGTCLRASPAAPPSPAPEPQRRPQHRSRSQPQSRATTPKLGSATGGRSASPLVVLEGDPGGDRMPRGKPGKAGSLKVRLSKLFRTKSSCGGTGGLLDKRPSLTSSTLSAGSLVDVWGSTCGNTEDGGRLQTPALTCTPPFTGETVSLVDVEISRRNCLHPPTPPPPPRRSLSLLDDLGGPPPPRVPSSERVGGASMQSLPPRPVGAPSSLSAIQHSLSLNDSFLRGLPRPVPLRADARRQAPRRSLERPDGGNFASSLRELEKCGWYWGPMTWEDAEMKLKGKADGSFLVRDSSDPRYILSLSFRSQGVTHHTRMEHYRGTFSLWCHPKFEDRCHSVVEFIERAITHSKNGKFLYFLRSRVPGLPPTPVQLLHPVSRLSRIKSLQHLCRFCIRQLVRVDHIQELPLPTPLIAYLRKFYYYDPEEEAGDTQT